jgi:hypothetical protein
MVCSGSSLTSFTPVFGNKKGASKALLRTAALRVASARAGSAPAYDYEMLSNKIAH